MSEKKTLREIVDKFFESHTSQSYMKPTIPEELANEMNEWHPVTLPGQVAIYRKSGFVNLEDGYDGEPAVLIIQRRPECRNQLIG